MRVFAASLAAFLGVAPLRAEVKNSDTFVYAMAGDIDTLDPHWQFDWVSNTAILQVYDTLVGYAGSAIQDLEPRLSTRLPSRANGLLSADGLTYTFPIRQGVRFHDGSPLTPEDVRYSLMRFMLLDRSGGPSNLLLLPALGLYSVRDAAGRVAPSAYEAAARAVTVRGDTVVLRLKRPFPPLLKILAGFGAVVCRRWVAEHGGWDGSRAGWERYADPAKSAAALYERANGTGPFLFVRWDRGARQLVLKANPEYWGRAPRLKWLLFKTVEELNTRKLMLQAGEADAIFCERQFLPQMQGLPGVVVEDGMPLLEVHNLFVMNWRVRVAASPYVGSGRLDGNGIPPDFFADSDVRRGFAHAFDYGAYAREGYRGRAERARGPIPRGLFGYDPKAPLVAFDPRRAEEHLRRAFGGRLWEKGFRLTALYQEGRADRQLACQILKRGIESLNPRFHLEVRGILWSTYLSQWVAGQIPLVNTRWAGDFADPHAFVYPLLHSHGRYHAVTGYHNPRADELIEKAAAELDEGRRLKMYAELLRIAYEDMPAIFTLDTYAARVRREWVKGWIYHPVVQSFKDIYKE